MTMNMPPTNYFPEQLPQSTLRSLGQYSFGRRNPSINHNHNINQSVPYSTASFPRQNVIRRTSPNVVPQGYSYQRPSLQGRPAEYVPVRSSNVQYVQPQYIQPQYIQPQYISNPQPQPQPQHYSPQPVYYQAPTYPHSHQYYQPHYSTPMIPTAYMPHPSRLSPSTLNTNFPYQQANFDVSYKIQQNTIHCVLCNQSYKPSQKSQHLLKHRQKINSINIRPIDEEQLKRLEKYNQMNKNKGLIVKPIVQPEEFNVQYKANQYVLKIINQYKDEDGPRRNQIAIQADSRMNENVLTSQLLGYNRTNQNSPRSIHQMTNLSQPIIQQQPINNPRLTNNTRFNDDSLRVQQQIGYQSSRYRESKTQKQTLNNNKPSNLLGYQSYKQSQRASNISRISSPVTNKNTLNNLSYSQNPNNNNELNFQSEQQTKLKYRAAQSYNEADEQHSQFRNSKKSQNNTLEKINEEEEFKNFTANLGYN